METINSFNVERRKIMSDERTELIEEDEEMEVKESIMSKGKSFFKNNKKKIIAGAAVIVGGLLVKKSLGKRKNQNNVSDDYDEFADDATEE